MGVLQLNRHELRGVRQVREEHGQSLRPGVALNNWMSRLMVLAAISVLSTAVTAAAGPDQQPAFKVLPPIVRGNLAVFPVVADRSYDTAQFITLDEGVRSGQVTITEAGEEPGLVRPGHTMSIRQQGAEVNRLVLFNNSPHALLLLAGEIVTGGKQDRVIGSDHIVPPSTGPIDLGVFCVEPGRWVASSDKFGSMGAQMAQPSVRMPAMAERNQSQVWANVRSSNAKMEGSLAAPEAAGLPPTTSYAKVFESAPVARRVASYGGNESEQEIVHELRSKGAVGVVVAINGRVLWADLFANTELLAKYWPKLMRSYVAEAITNSDKGPAAEVHEAQLYIDSLSGGREIVETEASVYRRTDVTGEGYRVFELVSLLPKTGFIVHITKMRQ